MSDYRLKLEFEDGTQGIYDVSPMLREGVFTQLTNPDEFNKATSDGFTVVWPCGVDIAPEELYEHCVGV